MTLYREFIVEKMQMYWLYDRYNMYAFSLVNSINKIMKTLIFINLVCFYYVILHLETIDLEWWITFFARQAAAANSGRNFCWFKLARKQGQFFLLSLLLSKSTSWGYLFWLFDGVWRGSRNSLFFSRCVGSWILVKQA